MGSITPPVDPRRRKQVRSYLKKHGRRGYVEAGRKGGGPNSPGSFTSDKARLAAEKRWQLHRERIAKETEADDGGQ